MSSAFYTAWNKIIQFVGPELGLNWQTLSADVKIRISAKLPEGGMNRFTKCSIRYSQGVEIQGIYTHGFETKSFTNWVQKQSCISIKHVAIHQSNQEAFYVLQESGSVSFDSCLTSGISSSVCYNTYSIVYVF